MRNILTVATVLITGLFFSSSAIAIGKDQGGFSHEVALEIRNDADALSTAGNWDTADPLSEAARSCNRKTNLEMYDGIEICGVKICKALGALFKQATDVTGQHIKMDAEQQASWQLLFDPGTTGYSHQCGREAIVGPGGTDLGWLP